MNQQLIAPKALTPEKLLEVFKGAEMEAELMEDGDVAVTSTFDPAQYGSPSGGPGAGELVVKKKKGGGLSSSVYVYATAGEDEPRPLDPVCTFVRLDTVGEITFVIFGWLVELTNLDPSYSDNYVKAFCNRVNCSEPFIKARASEDTRGLVIVSWVVPVTVTGISAQSLVRALKLFSHGVGAIQCGRYD